MNSLCEKIREIPFGMLTSLGCEACQKKSTLRSIKRFASARCKQANG